MIVLNEELQGLGLEEAISGWYRGPVLLIKALRPGTVIKDEAIPGLLRRIRHPTFVTINHGDFWRRVAAESAFCLLCLKLTANQAESHVGCGVCSGVQSSTPRMYGWEKSL